MTAWLKVKRLDKDLPLPAYQTDGSAGMDLYSTVDIVLTGNDTIGTGIAVAIPRGYVGLIKGRSGMAFKSDIEAFNGVIDSDYRGEVSVRLRDFKVCSNDTQSKFGSPFGTKIFGPNIDYVVRRGDRIAQLVVLPCPQILVQECSDLEDTARGTGGFGSTG